MDHTWVINVDIGGFGVPVARGGDPNTAGTQTSEGDRGNPLTELVGQVAAGMTVVGAAMVIGSGIKKKG
jgi:hypothetical protein